jgi:hypothetical protein
MTAARDGKTSASEPRRGAAMRTTGNDSDGHRPQTGSPPAPTRRCAPSSPLHPRPAPLRAGPCNLSGQQQLEAVGLPLTRTHSARIAAPRGGPRATGRRARAASGRLQSNPRPPLESELASSSWPSPTRALGVPARIQVHPGPGRIPRSPGSGPVGPGGRAAPSGHPRPVSARFRMRARAPSKSLDACLNACVGRRSAAPAAPFRSSPATGEPDVT